MDLSFWEFLWLIVLGGAGYLLAVVTITMIVKMTVDVVKWMLKILK